MAPATKTRQSVSRATKPMLSDRLFRIAIPGLCCLLMLLFEANTLYLDQAQENLVRKLSFEQTVVGDVARLDTSALEAAVVRYSVSEGRTEQSAVLRAYNAYLNAIDGFRASETGLLALKTASMRDRLARVAEASEALADPLATLDDAASTVRSLDILEGIRKSLPQVAETAVLQARKQVKASLRTVQRHQQIQTGLIFALLAGIFGWVWSYKIHNDVLEKDAAVHRQRAERFASKLEHDRLTGLINRPVFVERVGEALQGLSKGQTLSVLTVNLDSRLPETDQFDRSVEEAILTSTADILRHAIEPLARKECVARAEGKGFLVLSVCDEEFGLTPLEIANRIHDTFLRPISTEQGAYLISPAIGFAETRDPGHDPRELTRNSGLAASRAVKDQRRDVVVFEPAMRDEIERRLMLEGSFPRALETNEFLPHFQPQFDLLSGRVLGVEALARWYHAELGWISPSEFIPIAESNGDIVPLGWKILETACSEMRHLPQDQTLALNLSVAHILSDDIISMLEECLERTGFAANRLKLEITETTLRSDLEKISDTLLRLRALGVRLSLDDFGSGYSSLSYLTDFSWDEIKIDRSFCGKAVKDQKAREVLKLVMQLAQSTGTDVLVEGLESIDQRDVLADLGCTKGQGYLFCGPMAIDDIKTLFFPDQTHSGLIGA